MVCFQLPKRQCLFILLLAVAITRAQALLVIVGDPTVLGLDLLWRRFLYSIYQSGGWKGAPFPWDPEVNPEEAAAIPGVADNLVAFLQNANAGSDSDDNSTGELDHAGTSDA
jgi:hypothetical protein